MNQENERTLMTITDPKKKNSTRLVLLTTLLAGILVLFAGCQSVKAPTNPGVPSQVVLELSQGDDGELELCDDAGECESHSNPNDCAILLIEINTQTGETCERCLNEEGRLILQRCGETSVACAVVTLPDPDCVVCAYVGGDVVYSSCIAEDPDRCVTEVGPDGVECERCYDAGGELVVDECADACSLLDCPEILCAPGYHPTRLPGECCDTCVVDDPPDDRVCASRGDCGEGEVCTVEFGECNPPPGCEPGQDCLAVCYGVCRPGPSCEMVQCFAPPPECAPGTHLDMDYPNCCGVCVPDLPLRCEGPDPSLTCRSTGCEEGFVCSELASTVCVPSECFCDSESGEWVCTDDCRPALGCVPAPLACEDPNPALTCHYTGCPDGLECRPSGADGCVPSVCHCDGRRGEWICTADCGQMVACLPPETNCEGENPALTCHDTGCRRGSECRVSGEDGCVPSRCKCNERTGQWRCTRDCHPPLACFPIEDRDCRRDEDCLGWERCVFEDHHSTTASPVSHAHAGCVGRCVPLED